MIFSVINCLPLKAYSFLKSIFLRLSCAADVVGMKAALVTSLG